MLRIYEKEYDYIIPIGMNCRIATALDSIGVRKFPAVYDWGLFSINSICKAFEEEFENFVDEKYIEHYIHSGEVVVFNNYYNFSLPHEHGYSKGVKVKYEKRIKLLLKILNSDKSILFVRNLTDLNELNDKALLFYLDKLKGKGLEEKNHKEILHNFHDIAKQKFPNLDFDIFCYYFNKDTFGGEIESDEKVIFSYCDPSIYANADVFDHTACIHFLKNVKVRNPEERIYI